MSNQSALDLECGALRGQIKPDIQRLTGSGALGALALTAEVHVVATTGAATGTLANGMWNGQKKTIILRADGGDFVLTPASFANGTTITFNDANDTVNLMWVANHTSTTGKWVVLNNNGATIA